jgi:hypothetical protein
MRRSLKSPIRKPPPALAGYRVLQFAVVRRPVGYSGHSYFFVDDKELGPVPSLVIGESLDDSEIAILHANTSWHVLGVQGGYKTIRSAKQRAERMYPGISSLWVNAKVSKREARKYDRQMWQPFACSFCGKTPLEFKGPSMSARENSAVIRHRCVRTFQEEFENE